MNFSRLAVIALLSIAAFAPAAHAAKPKGEAQTGEWKGYIAIDAATGQVLAEDNPCLLYTSDAADE